ncbi:hypothetical protein HY612_03750 [Candidatus Roizmanbacteria bacterium]|nr:hypothetical protein [Candidatus Roizmanbacteria bacterium]
MKAEDKPKYVKGARKLFESINIEELISSPNNLQEIKKINGLIAIFTNFSFNDGQDLKNFFSEFQKWARAGERKEHIQNCASDMMQLIDQKIKDMNVYPIEPEVKNEVILDKPIITATKHILPFQRLSADDFVRLTFWILQRAGNYKKVEPYEGMGDKQRDVVAYSYNGDKHYYQCKRYAQITASTIKHELDLLKTHCDGNLQFKPKSIYFVVGCRISPQARDEVHEYGKSLGFKDITIWAEIELDERAKAIDGVLEEFFGFDTHLVRSVVQEALRSDGYIRDDLKHRDIPVLDLEGVRRSGGSTGQFILFNITNLSRTQTAIDCQWEVRGFDYSFRSPDSDRFSLQPAFSKEVTYRLDGKKPYKNEIKELSFVMEYKDMMGMTYFTRRELKRVRVPSGDFYEFQRGGIFYPAEQITNIGIKGVSIPIHTDDRYQSDFEVDISGKAEIVTIGVSRTFLSTWGFLDDIERIKSAIAELGSRVIRKMLLKKELNDYLFVADDFPQDYQNGFKGYQLLRDSL